MRKIVWIVVGVIAALASMVVGIVALAFYLTGDAVQAGDNFLTTLGQGKAEQAYHSAANGMRTSQDEAQFVHAASFLGLFDYQSRTWNQRSVRGSVGKLQGFITTTQGVSLPLQVDLVYEEGQWKVLGLEGDIAECKKYLLAHKAPSPKQTEELILASLLSFNRSVRARDFSDFHSELSGFWKRQIQPNALLKAFQPFIDQNVDLSDIKDVQPVITEKPAIDNNLALVVSGSYPTRPHPVQFTLKYVLERDTWKLSGIHVNR